MELRAAEISEIIKRQIQGYDKQVELRETGTVLSAGDGIARIYGLEGVASGELLLFPHDIYGLALNLEEDNVGAAVFGEVQAIREGDEVRRTGRIAEIPIGEAVLGRVVNALGQPLDGKGPIDTKNTQRIEIKAPQSGHVHQLSVHTVGGVIAAGEQIMLIVPDDDKLGVDMRVIPTDVDQLQGGQAVKLRFTAFNLRSTPQINGILRRVSADVQTDERSGKSYYVAHVDVAENELVRLGKLRVIPGMPVEAFVMTEEREAISYLLKPLMDQMQRALREE